MTPPRVIYLGIRTEKTAAEVGGWSKVDQMGLRDALIYDTTTRKFSHYTKSEVADLITILQAADLVVGFNQLNFDYKVLSTYSDKDLVALPNFDMLAYIEQTLDFRVSRDNLVQNTLGVSKNDKIYSNFVDKVDKTKKLFAHACKEGYLSYENKRFGGTDHFDTSDWAETARTLIQRNKFLAETKVTSEKNISENPDNSIPNTPNPSINPWKDTDKVSIDLPITRDHNSTVDQIGTRNIVDTEELQNIVERQDFESSPAEISNIKQYTEETRQINYRTPDSRILGSWCDFRKMARLHGHGFSVRQYMDLYVRGSNNRSLKNNAEKQVFRSEYIEGYGTLVGKRENGRIVQIYKIPLCRSAYEACIQSGKRDEMS